MSNTILITGGTGFLGRRLGQALAKYSSVVLVGRNHKQNRMAEAVTGCRAIAADVVNREAIRDVVAEVRPNVIIHAAASKYVDIAEHQPMECVDVNIVGSQNVARVAIDRGVPLVVGVSTDKAAPPVSNTYGLCKALMERMFVALNGKTATRFVCIRPGNIPWSTGSFLPIWKTMLAASGVIGTTGPEMTRFFSTASEVVNLVTTAIDRSNELQGTIVTRTMKAARIGRILELFVSHYGGSWERIQGRPGERQHEFLVGEPELAKTSEATYGGVKHYVLTPNELSPQPLAAPLSSSDAEPMTDAEILELIANPPTEEC